MFDNLRQLNEAKAAKLENQQERTEKELSELQTQEVFVKSIKALADFMEGNTSKTVVLNQLRDYATSQDIDSLSQSIDSLHGTLKTHENTDLSPVVDVLNKAVDNLEKIPKEHPEKLTIPTPKDYSKQFDTLVAVMESVKDGIEAQETVVEAPVVNVEAPSVQVDAPDLKPLAKELDKALSKSFNASVSKIKIPKPADIKPIVAEQKKTTKSIDRLYKLMEENPFGGGGGGVGGVAAYKDQSGDVTQVQLDAYGLVPTKIQASDSPSIDAFGRWRTSEPTTLFDSKQLYDSQPLFWDDQETSGGGTSSTHSVDKAATTISVSNATAGTRVRQTFMRFNYQPGKSQEILCTFSGLHTSTGITKRVGYFDSNNGLFLQSSNGVLSVVVRSKVTGTAVDTAVAQSNWNIDKLDGTGASGVTLDPTKSQILFIDFEWLGVGRVRFGFVVDGKIYYCHEVLNANNTSTVYMSTPNLPLRYEISNDGTGAADDFVHICSSVISEGGAQKNGILQHVDSNKVTYTTAGTRYIVMAGRLKTTHQSVSIDIENVSASIFSNDYGHWEFIVGGTLTGTLTFADKANSATQIALGNGTQTIANGFLVDGRYLTTSSASNFAVPNAIRMGADIAGTSQTWYLVFTPNTNNTVFAGSVTWRELS